MIYTIHSPAILLRETSPACALNIVRHRRCIAGPILGDGGMNSVIENHPAGLYYPDQAEENGAVLRFEWDGRIDRPEYTLYPPIDVLIDQHPHRAFLMAGTGQHLTSEKGSLRLTDVTFKDGHGWHEAVGEPPTFDVMNIFHCNTWKTWWSGHDRRRWAEKVVQQIAEEVAGVLSLRLEIKVVLPPKAIYRSTLTKTYPQLI